MPEAATAWTARPDVTARRFMVATANPLATEAGHGVLEAGGAAREAAIAVERVLGLVEPQPSGIRGRAGKPVPFAQARLGGHAGCPGWVLALQPEA